ncbi:MULTISPECIES: gamma-glutamyl-gamma-aminobutyrate hydrolase family protein [unclassified Pseudonocardia]|uniref:gamma-glutamyl-gamma-aminobutyrate hydrolase family protein n=1 Tax=unclassified Pseudonocardia TaxID=2619320 RepID=UPI001CF686CB|nr:MULTISPECIES: gamma-glutamyl-gamma-aminobutyrate hydrolase family protein [unclassified Pseudonocardia]
MRRPLRIAVPDRLDSSTTDPRDASARRLLHDVVAMIAARGLEAVLVRETDLDGFDGLVLPGGNDIDPVRYGAQPCAEVYGVQPDQDALDCGLAEAALSAGVPVLGICRGLQVLNVVRGGTLVPDLPPGTVLHRDSTAAGPRWAWHEVALRAGSLLAEEVGAHRLLIASGHHQAVDRLGAGLTVDAVADDGVVEAFSDAEHDVLAVQWHPEATGREDEVQAAPVRWFAAAVTRRATAVTA